MTNTSNDSDADENDTEVDIDGNVIIPGIHRPLTPYERLFGTNPKTQQIMRLILLDATDPWVDINAAAAA